MASAEFQQLLTMMKARPMVLDAPSVEQMRDGMSAFAAMVPTPADVTYTPVVADGVTAEWVAAPGASGEHAVLYLHGGGYVIGSIATHRDLASRISRASGARLLVADYRLGPEHPFPAAVEDAVACYRWLLAEGLNPAQMAIAGDSAGGGLTVAALIALRDAGEPLPACAVVMSPWVDLTLTGDSMKERDALDPMVHADTLGSMAAMYLNGADPRQPLASPVFADLRGLPPLLIQVGTSETLYDDATRLAERASAEGVEVTFEPWEDMIHVFQSFSMLPEAARAIARIGEFVKARAGAVASP
jgi:epsilon-lactone hydrolase